jgi:hypothetical protein
MVYEPRSVVFHVTRREEYEGNDDDVLRTLGNQLIHRRGHRGFRKLDKASSNECVRPPVEAIPIDEREELTLTAL